METAVRQGLEVVAVTDHNTGEYIPKITGAAGGVNLFVFPGVEITVSGGAHLLTLFDFDRGPAAVTGLLSVCGISDQQMGQREACASCSFEEAMGHAAHRQGLNIAAHVDKKDGFLVVFQGLTAQRIILSEHLSAAEVTGENSELLEYLDNTKTGYERSAGPLPRLTFSDAHALDQIGRRFTWIKMTKPSLEGLRLALEDGSLSVKPGAGQQASPNDHASLAMDSIEIESTQYMGRDKPLRVALNPWLNAIVGGRGTGKSSIVELFRIALRREEELPESLREGFKDFKRIPQNRQDRGLLRADTRIRICYRKDGIRYRVNWSQAGDLPAIEVEEPGGSWQPDTGDVNARFPVRIYSQKQIFEIAREPGALLTIVDDSTTVDRRSWEQDWSREESRFLALRAKVRELQTRLGDQDRLKGELKDVIRKLEVFETAGHADILRELQRRRRQERALEGWEEGLRQSGERLNSLVANMTPPAFDSSLFDPSDAADAHVLQAVATASARLQEIGKELEAAARQYDALVAGWQRGRQHWAEADGVRQARLRYDSLLERLQQESAGDPSEYGRLVQVRHTLEQRLSDLKSESLALAGVEDQSRASRGRLRELRRELTRRRERFLSEVVGDNAHVRIEVIPFGDEQSAEADLQGLLQTSKFKSDFRTEDGKSGILPGLYLDYMKSYGNDPSSRDSLIETLTQRLEDLKNGLSEIGRGEPTSMKLQDQRFARHLAGLKPETFDRLDLWFPEDSLKVTYSRGGKGDRFAPLEQGSPGQKAAAILAFLLSYGEEPMILDQPEDDLDNHLISELVVQQLRKNKARRQFIVVTHNPNIVVNADAELVLALDFQGGQTRIVQSGGLQELSVRDEVCRVMEGGREALERRYRRIGRRRGDA